MLQLHESNATTLRGKNDNGQDVSNKKEGDEYVEDNDDAHLSLEPRTVQVCSKETIKASSTSSFTLDTDESEQEDTGTTRIGCPRRMLHSLMYCGDKTAIPKRCILYGGAPFTVAFSSNKLKSITCKASSIPIRQSYERSTNQKFGIPGIHSIAAPAYYLSFLKVASISGASKVQETSTGKEKHLNLN